MAEKRMFSKKIIDSDAFLDMPQSTQLLYFHLSMRADDDGFINQPKTIMRMCGCKDDDISILISKKFIIPFETGIVVIKHWQIHNYIQKDRYHPTTYKKEKDTLKLDENNAYTTNNNDCIQDVHRMDTEVRLGKTRLDLDKVSIENKQVTHAIDYQQLINIIAKECNILIKRQSNLIDVLGKIDEIAVIEKMLYDLELTEEEATELFKHANKTYVSKPSMDRCTIKWVLNNISKVKNEPEENFKKEKNGRTRTVKPVEDLSDYDIER